MIIIGYEERREGRGEGKRGNKEEKDIGGRGRLRLG
jgi:hypothetical protein